MADLSASYQRRLGKAQAEPTLDNVLALDGLSPASHAAAFAVGLTATSVQDVGSVGAGAVATFDVTVTGAVAGQCVVVAPPAALNAGLICFAFVSAADTVTVRVFNGTAAPIDPASGTYRVRVLPN